MEILTHEIEPMIWCYAEDVSKFLNPGVFVKYRNIFKNVWAASAYKGAGGELNALTNLKRRYLNHVSWIDLINQNLNLNFIGIALTGWSRLLEIFN